MEVVRPNAASGIHRSEKALHMSYAIRPKPLNQEGRNASATEVRSHAAPRIRAHYAAGGPRSQHRKRKFRAGIPGPGFRFGPITDCVPTRPFQAQFIFDMSHDNTGSPLSRFTPATPSPRSCAGSWPGSPEYLVRYDIAMSLAGEHLAEPVGHWPGGRDVSRQRSIAECIIQVESSAGIRAPGVP